MQYKKYNNNNLKNLSEISSGETVGYSSLECKTVTTHFGVLLISSELADYVMLGDYLACASVASSTVLWYDGVVLINVRFLGVAHGTVQAEALAWWH